jgi:tRNA A37 threonylcarbamoyladenosine synthetase subunit TsaC/SUA5/YrdC
MDYFSDPYAIYEKCDDQVPFIIDGGFGKLKGSTIVNCVEGEPFVVRQGLGEIHF